jgi:hypothetical protein
LQQLPGCLIMLALLLRCALLLLLLLLLLPCIGNVVEIHMRWALACQAAALLSAAVCCTFWCLQWAMLHLLMLAAHQPQLGISRLGCGQTIDRTQQLLWEYRDNGQHRAVLHSLAYWSTS